MSTLSDNQMKKLLGEFRPPQIESVETAPALAPATGSASFLDPVLLDRCRLSDEDAKQFRNEARLCCRRDEATGAIIVCYVHPDGRILIDAIRLPTPNPPAAQKVSP